MNKKQFIIKRIILFTFILSLGLLTTMWAGEGEGLALSDLSTANVGAMTTDVRDQTLYAALDKRNTQPGIYRSLDKGRSWQLLSAGPASKISALSLNPLDKQTLYAGTETNNKAEMGSLWRSVDSGNTWDQYTLRLPSNTEGFFPTVEVLEINPQHPGYLYVGTAGQGLYRFNTDGYGYELLGGSAWRGLYVKDVITDHQGQMYALTTSGLFQIDGSALRPITTLPDHAISLAVSPASAQTLYAGTVARGIYRSDDGGQTWANISQNLGLEPGVILQVSAISIDAADPAHIAVATAYGVGNRVAPGHIYNSFDGGESWHHVATVEAVVSDLTITDGDIYAATATGLSRYGEPFSPSSTWPYLAQRMLTSPSGIQILLLSLTLALGGWVLLGKTEGLLYKGQSLS